jgi:hypothetical protein
MRGLDSRQIEIAANAAFPLVTLKMKSGPRFLDKIMS